MYICFALRICIGPMASQRVRTHLFPGKASLHLSCVLKWGIQDTHVRPPVDMNSKREAARLSVFKIICNLYYRCVYGEYNALRTTNQHVTIYKLIMTHVFVLIIGSCQCV
jgi:hypothetical protein